MTFHQLACCTFLALFTASGLIAQEATSVDTPDKDYSAELPRIPPKSPEEALASFDVRDGFTVELVAAEPLVQDPIAFAFNAQGHLFVVEMKDYSEQETESLGSIALLKDTDGDGKMDERTTFVDGLSWPTAIWPWRDGVLVAAAPRITWYRDTNADGKCDSSEVWFDGFQRANVQGLVNSLRWGVDGFLHGATSSSGADLDHQKVQLRGRDFAIDPLNQSIIPESGGGQHGMNFNRWGDKFVTSNSDHLQQVIDLDQWLSDHPATVSIPSLRLSIAEDGPQAEVFRASPVEPWRIVRTRLRKSGVAPGIVEGGGRAAGYFTGATGTLILDSELGFGVEGFDTAIVCDVGSNLVHRKQMRPKGLFWTANRIDPESELLRSKDIWFRPVQIGDGPDGSLYIADMYREVIEHPKSLPPMIKKHLDLTSGRDKGRIWRLKPHGHAEKFPQPTKWIADCSNRELVDRLTSPLSWQRLSASQQILERHAQDVAPELRQVALKARPEAQILALHCLNRLKSLDLATLKSVLNGSTDPVTRHAIALARTSGFASQLVDELQSVASSNDASVQLQIAMTVAELTDESKLKILPSLLKSEEPLVRSIIIVATGESTPKLVPHIAALGSNAAPWYELIIQSWSKSSSPNSEMLHAMSTGLSSKQESSYWLSALRKLPSANEAQRLVHQLEKSQLESLLNQIEQAITSVDSSKLASIDACKFVGFLPKERQLEIASDLLAPAQSEAIQSAVSDSIMWSDPVSASALLMERFASFTPGLQRTTLTNCLRYPATLPALASALEKKKIAPSQIPPDLRERLLATTDQPLRQRFLNSLQVASADRQAIIADYASALSESDQSDEGKLVFNRACAQCHRIGDSGSDVGPPLKQLADKSPQQLLETILDPNREVDPKYAGYSVLLNDGRVFAGIIAEENASQITIAEAGGKRHTLARSEITQLKSSGVSLMPVGLEQQITPTQMSQLIQFLKRAQPK